ncbi:MAG: hypothetical protein IJR35_11585 [Synergistaceae bacterium]|nr:hypothetical protein [Synergistaceae bacterium]
MISTKHSSLGGRSIADMWLMTAAGLSLQAALPDEYLTRIAKEGILNGGIDENKYGFLAKYSYEAPEWHNVDKGYVSTEVTVKYMSRELHMAVWFSDFTVGALLPADEGLYVQTVTENGSVKNVEASSVKNDTSGTVTASQHVSKTTSETLTSTVNHSSSYSFTEGVKASAEASSFGIYKMSIEVSAQFTQAFSDGWSKSEGISNSKTTGSDVSVTLPPYTNVLIRQGEAKTTVTTRYNCPVVIGYKVRIYLSRGPILPIGNYNFGSENSNARKDLNHRAFEEGSKQYDKDSIDWAKVLADSDAKDAITKITKNVPMSSSGATIVYTTNTTYSEVAGKTAIYPLNSIQLGKSNISFIDSNNVANMKIGNYSYVDYLTVNGLNARGAEYYGFDKSAGNWIVIDENQKEFASERAPVVLEKDSVSGLTKFRAVRAGTCYLKYLISEKKYPTNYGSDSYTKNADLSSTAVLKIVVAEDEVTYEVSGSYNGVVNSEPESLEGEDKLEVSVFDKTGKEIEGSYIWDKKQLKGINLTSDGKVSFTRPGNYHVRVTNQAGNIYSDWVQITAEVLGGNYVEPEDEPIGYTGIADEGTTFIIAGSYTGGVSNDEECIEGAGKLNVAAFDSAGREQAYSYTWEQKKDSDGMTIDEAGFVSFTKTGSYYVRVKSGQVYSDWTEINANELAPARFIKAPSANFDTYDGEEHILLSSGDTQYEGGVSIVYALGSDDVNAPEEYNSEIPSASEAGKYYVWCKVMGDENHDNSEPVCVTAKISDGSEPEEENGNRNENGN